jgi:cell division protein ZapE
MILYNLMKALYDNGVSFIMTSNYEPSTLYPDGLHRDRILPTIALLKERMDVLNVDAGVAYRGRALEQVEAYYTPLNAATDHELRQAFAKLADTQEEDPHVTVEGRELRALRRAGTVIWFDFQTLCGGPRSQNDYLEIASRFHTVILSGVPMMSAGQSSEARRFTWLIDVFYDQGVKLIISAEVEPEELYTSGMLANEFHRTVSRIVEMQSREYMEKAQRGGAAALT